MFNRETRVSTRVTFIENENIRWGWRKEDEKQQETIQVFPERRFGANYADRSRIHRIIIDWIREGKIHTLTHTHTHTHTEKHTRARDQQCVAYEEQLNKSEKLWLKQNVFSNKWSSFSFGVIVKRWAKRVYHN